MVTKPDPAKQYARRSGTASPQRSMSEAFRPAAGETTRHLAARIPETLHKEVRQYLAEHDLTVQEFVRSAVIHELKRNKDA